MSAGATDKIATKVCKEATRWQSWAFFVCFLFARPHFFVAHWKTGSSALASWSQLQRLDLSRRCRIQRPPGALKRPPFLSPLICVSRDGGARRAAPYRSVKGRKSVKYAAVGLSPSRTINIVSLAASLELQRAPGSPLGMFWSRSCSRRRGGCVGFLFF